MGQPLCCLGADAGVWGEKSYGDGSPHTCDSAGSPCFRGCRAFLHRHFAPQSPPSPPHHLSLQWTTSFTLDPFTLHKLQLPAAAPSRGPHPCPGYVWLRQGLILIPLRLPQISCFTLSLKCFSSDSDNCPDVGIGPLLRFPHPLRAGPVILTLLVPSSYRVFHGSVFFSTGQVLLFALSWWEHACTSVSEGVFLMYPWREMYSTSTYSSAILFFPPFF